MTTKAYQEGFNTYFADHWQNPYKRGTQECADWANGLNSAKMKYSTKSWHMSMAEYEKEAR